MQSETKICQNCKKDFIIEPEDFNFYEKMKVPAPTWCPECRMVRRLSFRNESMLFRRLDSHTGKEIFSGFSPKSKVITYENNYWYSSDWDQLETGVDYDFSKTFFEQFRLLFSRAPVLARSVYNMVNSDYCQEASECKNAYLCFNADYIENSAYLRKSHRVKDSFDCYEVDENELCYENVLVDKSYQTFFSTDCESCVDVWFSKGLRGCTNCFGCVNLRNKSYYYFNKACTREEYLENIRFLTSGSYKIMLETKKKVANFWLNFPNKFYHGLRVINSTGERIFDSKNVKDSYFVKNAQNMRYCQDVWIKASDCYDYSVWGDGAENIYECMTCGMGVYNLKFCFHCWEEARDLEYCAYCIGSKNCFGCVGLYKKEYCIFNKQYTKEEYFLMVQKIKKQMNEVPYIDKNGRIYRYGEFFSFDISPLSYNESLAQFFFPLDKNTAEEKGYQWRENSTREYDITIDAKDLKDNIDDIEDTILNEAIKCINCNRAYRIISLEFQFYKRMKLPLPRTCHNCRFIERFKLVNPPKLWHRKCMCDKTSHNHQGKCEVEFETPYAPERPEIVYCEKCYQQEVY